MIQKIHWILKQVLPFTYRSEYKEEGKYKFSVWNMWLGKSFNIQTFEIVPHTGRCKTKYFCTSKNKDSVRNKIIRRL